jgi:hypothetical protein
VDPVPDPYFSENVVGLGIEAGTSVSVARSSDYLTSDKWNALASISCPACVTASEASADFLHPYLSSGP